MICPKCGQIVSKSRRNRGATCGCETNGQGVYLRSFGELRDGMSRAGFTGVRKCNKGWTCPTCAKARQAEQAAVLHSANLGFRTGEKSRQVYLLTLTIPHRAGMGLRELRCAVTKAYQKAHTGKAEATRRKRFGVRSTVRRLEVTSGPNGWHPHVHAMVFCDRNLPPEAIESMREWYFVHFGKRIEAAGFERPRKACIDITMADREGRYLAKMGLLELAGDTAKRARCSHCGEQVLTRWVDGRRACSKCGHEVNRTPWQILQDYHHYHEARDRKLWQAYGREIHGARQLTWSRWRGGIDLRKAYPTDRQQEMDETPSYAIWIKRELWKKLSARQRTDLLDAAELGELQRVNDMLGEYAPCNVDVWTSEDTKPLGPDAYKLTFAEKEELSSAGAIRGKRLETAS